VSHTLSLVPTEDDEVDLTCTEGGHDWARRVTTLESVLDAQQQHDLDVRRSLKPGLYWVGLSNGARRLYRRHADGKWSIVRDWTGALEPAITDLEFVAEAPEGDFR
jgi:hypothetical protein